MLRKTRDIPSLHLFFLIWCEPEWACNACEYGYYVVFGGWLVKVKVDAHALGEKITNMYMYVQVYTNSNSRVKNQLL